MLPQGDAWHHRSMNLESPALCSKSELSAEIACSGKAKFIMMNRTTTLLTIFAAVWSSFWRQRDRLSARGARHGRGGDDVSTLEGATLGLWR
jgi:hypothetical protein